MKSLASGIVIMENVHDPYEHDEDVMGEDIHGGYAET